MKIAGSIMIIAFFMFLGIKAAAFKKEQIRFLDDMIYLCEYITLMLRSSAPETSEMLKKIKSDERVGKYDLNSLYTYPGIDSNVSQRLEELKNILGRYDADTQICYINEISNTLKTKKAQYTDYYKQHYKLYYMVSTAMGLLVTILLF